MNAAKVPSDSNDWDSLDIFLFTNGQEYSPPRKYHLRYEDLYYWETTLGLLAKSQYGPLNSGINLFSLSGHMINSPLELTNNGSYVAVVPPEPFIPAGYENYLIKASKSWERRHSKKVIADNQVQKAGEITILSGVSSAGVNQEIINIKTPDQNITIAAVGTGKIDKDLQRPGSANFQPSMMSSIAGSIKPIDRRKLSNQPTPIETRTSILRKLTNTSNIAQSPSSNKRHSSIKSRDLKDPKGNVKVMTKTNATANNLINSVDKTPVKLPRSLDNSVVPSTNLERAANFTRMSNVDGSRKSDTKENKVVDKTDDKDIILISNVYRSIDEVPSNFVDAGKVLLVEPKPPRRDSPQFQRPIPEESPDKNITPLIKDIMVRNSIVASEPQYNIPNNNVDIAKGTSRQSFGEPVKQSKKSNDQFTAVLNKGESVNLKLNIEVKNGECTVKPVVDISPTKTYSLTEVKLEKGSCNKINPDMFTSKSFDSLLTPESNDCCRKCQKVVVVKCPCEPRTSETSRGDPKSKFADSDAKTYFIIVPIVTRSVKEWNREPDVKTVSEKEVQNTPSLCKINRTVVSSEYTNRSIECEGDCCIQRDCCTVDRNEYVTIQRVSTCNNNFIHSEYVFATQTSEQESQKIEFKPSACINTFCIRDCQDNETQTEWCSVLLEVRRHEDSHYTFHLPPLEVLKILNL